MTGTGLRRGAVNPRHRWRRNVEEARRNTRVNRLAVIGTVLAISLAMLVTTMALIIWQQTRASAERWQRQAGVSVYVCTASSVRPTCAGRPTPGRINEIGNQLAGIDGVERVRRETSFEAYEQFLERHRGVGGAGYIDETSLPESFRLDVKDAQRDEIVALILTWEDIDTVVDQQQSLQRFFSVVDGVTRVAGLLAAAQTMLASTMLVTMIRTSVRRKRDEIRIMELVGAETRRIRGPFAVETLLITFLGAAIGIGAAVTVVTATDLVATLLAVDTSTPHIVSSGLTVGIGAVLGGWALAHLTVRGELNRWDKERGRRT